MKVRAATSDPDMQINSSKQHSPPNLLRWLSKTSAVCEHTRCIADLATSPRHSYWLDGPVKVVAVEPPRRRLRAIIEENSLQTVLIDAGCTTVERVINDFFSRLSWTLVGNWASHTDGDQKIGETQTHL